MAQNMNYPGVYWEEIDNSFVPSVDNSSYSAVLGRAKKGIPNAKVLVKREDELISIFGTPIVSGSYPLVSAIDYGIYTGLEFLKETSNLYYVRLTDGTEKYSNVTVPTTGESVVSGTYGTLSAAASTEYPSTITGYPEGNTLDNNYDLSVKNGAPSGLRFAAIGPGAYGNNYAIAIWTTACGSSANSATYGKFYDWKDVYDDPTVTSNRIADKVFKVQVFSKNSNESFNASWWASVSGSPLETFYASTDFTLLDNQGNSLFVNDVINGKSNYVYATVNVTDGTVPAFTTSAFGLLGGADASSLSQINASTVWSFFSDRESSPLNVAIALPRAKDNASNTSEVAALDALVGKRRDFNYTVQVANLTASTYTDFINQSSLITIASNPSYASKCVGWHLVYDRYNGSKVYLPNNIFQAAACLRVDRVAKPWDAPANTDYGLLPSGKQFVNITEQVGGDLYKNANINVVKFFRGLGYAFWGQKTAQMKETARNRINVRRMLITIQKNIDVILKGFLFKGNTVKARERVTALINSYLQGVLADGGVQSFRVVCNDTNNTSTTIAQNLLNVDVYVQPTYVIEFIKFSTIISSDSVTTSEVQ